MYSLKCIVFSVCLFLTLSSHSQTAEDVYKYAINLYNSGKYRQSIIEFKRVALFSDTLSDSCFLWLAVCNTKLNSIEEAAAWYEKAIEAVKDDSIKTEIAFRKINLRLSHNQPIYALTELNELKFKPSLYFEKKKLFYLAISTFLLDDYESSEQYMHALSTHFTCYDSTLVAGIYDRAARNYRKNTKVYSVFSAIIPGSGQMASGAYRDGINSFLLNAAIVTLDIYTFSRLGFFDTFLSLFPITKRYYFSNITKAHELAELKKEESKINLYNYLLEYIDAQLN